MRLKGASAGLLGWTLWLCCALVRGQQAARGTVDCKNGQDIVRALQDPEVHTAYLMYNMVLSESDWAGVSTPYTLTRNFTVAKHPTLLDMPILDLSFATGHVQLMQAVVLSFVDLVLTRFRGDTTVAQAPGFDLLTTSQPGLVPPPVLSIVSGGLVMRACMPVAFAAMATVTMPRPPQYGGNHSVDWRLPQPACVNDSVQAPAPPLARCWPARGMYRDLKTYGANIDAQGSTVELSGLAEQRSTEMLMTDECAQQLGPLGCWLFMFGRASTPSPPPSASHPAGIGSAVDGTGIDPTKQPSASPADSSSGGDGTDGSGPSSDTVAAIVGGVVGGEVVLHVDGAGGAGGMAVARLTLALLVKSRWCVYGAADEAAAPLVVVTPFTPPRADFQELDDTQAAQELRLVPVTLGKGTYGRVMAGEYRGRRVAVKLLTDPEGMPPDQLEPFLETFAREAEVLGRCEHANVVKLLAANLRPPRVCLPGVNLLPLSTMLQISIQVARGLEYLHPTIVHRDLKPGNVLVNGADTPERLVAKLTDFGLSRLRNTVLVTKDPEAGTPAYTAPECFDPTNYEISHQADMYSLGVLMWEMIVGERPFDGLQMVAIAYRVTVQGKRPPWPAGLERSRCPKRLRALIEECWDPVPRRRPAAAEVVKRLMMILQSVQSKIDTSSHENSDSEHRSCDGASAAPGAGGGFGGGGARGSKRQMLPADLDGKPLPPRVMHGVDLARISAELAKSEQVARGGSGIADLFSRKSHRRPSN
eukprot:XP_001701019.1 predicted protein [Chlamydomonas reinhardtii]